MKTSNQIDELLANLRKLGDDERLYPFPSEDCKHLFPHKGDAFQEFTGLLDVYGIDLGGYAKYPRQLISLSLEERERVIHKFERPFFETHPQFKEIGSSITDLNTPKLFLQLAIYEKIRIKLLELLNKLNESNIVLPQ